MGSFGIPEYEIFAIRYATRDAQRRDHFIGGDPHEGPMPMDYFTWVVRSQEDIVVVDTGFNADVAARRGRTFLRCPIGALELVGINPDDVAHAILTHLHYDHVGNLGLLSKAHFYLQEAEMHFATGRHMRHKRLSHSFEVEDVCDVVRLNFGHRVTMLTGGTNILPGIAVHPVGGHSLGLQFVTVNTARGTVVLASDVTHFYENMESGRPFPTAVHIEEMLDGFDALREAADGNRDAIIPGHDPEVMRRYPAAGPGLDGIIARLDVPPLT